MDKSALTESFTAALLTAAFKADDVHRGAGEAAIREMLQRGAHAPSWDGDLSSSCFILTGFPHYKRGRFLSPYLTISNQLNIEPPQAIANARAPWSTIEN